MDRILNKVLVPLARLLVARGVGFRDFAEHMKRAYVAAAGEDLTDSQLAVRTGLQRRDVARIRATPVLARASHLDRLVRLWQDSHVAADGGPMVLPRKGPAPSFEALAFAVRKDVHPRTVLDTLVEHGTVVVEGDQVRLVQSSYVPGQASVEEMALLADNLGDHAEGAVANVLGQVPPFFDRALSFEGLTERDARALEALFEARQMDLLEDLAEEAAVRHEAEAGAVRVRFGGYGYWR